MKSIQIELKWGIIFVLMGLIWMLLERLVGLHSTHIALHPTYTNLIAIPATLIYVLALLDKRKNYYKGKMTYLQGLSTGLVITAVVTLFTPLSQYIISTVITPNYFENARAYAVSQELLTREEAENYFTLNNYIIQGLVSAPTMGLITSAAVAVFTTKKSKSD